MKKNSINFYILFLVVFSLQNLYANSCKESHHKHKDCMKQKFISSKDVNHKGKGLVIKKPGHYILCEDIAFKPKGCGSKTAITIQSSDVTLDMNSHTLSQKSPSDYAFPVLGIAANNIDSISISNGSITDFSDAGIRIQDSTTMTIDTLNILDTGVPSAFGGLQINNSSDIVINNINSLHNFGSGMYLHGVIKATVSNSHFDDNLGGNVAPQFFTGPGIVASGAYIDSSEATESSAILVQDCTFNRNSAGGDAGGMEIGVYALLPIKNVTVLRCEFLDNNMTGQESFFNDASGLVLVDTENFVIKDCIASGQRHPSAPGGLPEVSGATGFSINASSNGLIENCQGFDNTGQGTTSLGLRARGCFNITIKNCEFSHNVNTGSGQAFGLYTDVDNSEFFPTLGSTYIIESCIAQENSSASGLHGGLKIANVTCSTIQNCTSQNNGIGIVVTDSNSPQQRSHNIFKENIVQCNTVSGINDQTSVSNNAYIQNIARSNGPAGTTNYVGLPSGTPIVNWSIAAGFPVNPNPFANLNVIP